MYTCQGNTLSVIKSAKHVLAFRFQTHRGHRGFTLVELMIVIVILAIVLALSMPSWRESVEKRHVVSGAEQITSFISLARGEAF